MQPGRVGFGSARGELGCPLTKTSWGKARSTRTEKKKVRIVVALPNQDIAEFGQTSRT